jgi:hypothetical protein
MNILEFPANILLKTREPISGDWENENGKAAENEDSETAEKGKEKSAQGFSDADRGNDSLDRAGREAAQSLGRGKTALCQGHVAEAGAFLRQSGERG